MDDSQSSDIFLNLNNKATMDEESYELMLTKIKMTAGKNVNDKNNLLEHFSLILEDCRICIYQGFDLILTMLDSAVQIERICSNIKNAVCILQILSTFLKNVIDNITIECHQMKSFPTSTGNIILLVFSHCKDSECIYGSHLHDVEKQLKDLFRSCHDLQLTYLMCLGKLFIFDLTDKEEQDILLETLDTNLKICEIAQALDVKTMAEQWKAYTAICEKYSNFLLDKDVFNNCTKLLTTTIQNNIKTALEAPEYDKIVTRSMKVGNFSLKILVRITSIFKDATSVRYDHIVELLNIISICNCNYYEITSNKSTEFSKLLNAHLSTPLDALVSQLVNNEIFLKVMFSNKIRDSNDAKCLGNIFIIISIIRATLLGKESIGTKLKVIEHIFFLLPYCHTWFNMDVKCLNIYDKQMSGLYEHFLVHAIALAASFTCNEYQMLERYLYEAILGTDYSSAVFSANMWISLCSIANPLLQVNILQNLLRMYQKLENHRLFHASPQEINLSYTIVTFFKNLKYTEKLQIYKNFNIQESKNVGVWCSLKISNLPENFEEDTEKMITEKLISNLDNISKQNESNEIENLIKYMKVAATCSFNECNSKLEEFILRSWCKACPDCSSISLQNNINTGSISYFRYIQSLVQLTDWYMEYIEDRGNLIKIQHMISKILHTKNTELIIVLIKTFLKLFILQRDYEDNLDRELLISTLKILNMEYDLQKHLFHIIISHEDFNNFINPILKDQSLREINYNFMEYKRILQDPIQRRNKLKSVSELKFIHKCLENPEIKLEKKFKSTFDIDIDSLFEVESEPVHKKLKFDTNIENLILNLENDVSMLTQAKENILSNDHKNRLKNVCDNLRNIFS